MSGSVFKGSVLAKNHSFCNAFSQTVLRIRIHQIHIFGASQVRIHKLEVWIRILLSSCKNSMKNFDSLYFVTLFDFLSLKNYVNVPSKSNKQKNFYKNQFFVDILKVNDKNSRIRIRIHQLEAWIRGSRSGSGSTPKCHGSATLFLNLKFTFSVHFWLQIKLNCFICLDTVSWAHGLEWFVSSGRNLAT